ncbi:MAG: DUF6737 family protein [Pleurocapsa sp.]
MNSKPETINIWNYKPWWCQPWSILLTGIVIITGSWFLLTNIWLTGVISIFILAWWSYFLILYPQMMQEYLSSNSSENDV